MCGISGLVHIDHLKVPRLPKCLEVMNQLQKHRGPDGRGVWINPAATAGVGHVRLAIIDLKTGQQPMKSDDLVITYNGEIYNYRELRRELQGAHVFRTDSDTEVVLAAYRTWGPRCVERFRGMFAFAIWDERTRSLFCARDQIGIKPFYYTVQNGVFYFASEVKALLPFVDRLEILDSALQDYLTFQTYLDSQTPFRDIQQLEAGHTLTLADGKLHVKRYWEVFYDLDWKTAQVDFEAKLRSLLEESIDLHLRSDVPVGAYVSGGLDSSSVAALAKRRGASGLKAFVGKFSREGELFDESAYARELSKKYDIELLERDITAQDFIDNIERVIYHLDYPIAGPGSFPQYCLSEFVAPHRKVLLGGQGGDEIFGGYTRYLLAYFEQCIKGAIDGTLNNGNFVVTYESIIPNLAALANYKPLMQEFFAKGLFEPMDRRYFQLVNRSGDLTDEIRWNELMKHDPFEKFCGIFHRNNVTSGAYFDKMTHFDFKTLLPALLHVEDRMSMAHGLESRVPLVDTKIVEFAATIPADKKFKDGTLKLLFANAIGDLLPPAVLNRKNKMGFPVPFNQWLKSDLRDFVHDVFSSTAARHRRFVRNDLVLKQLDGQAPFSRKLWGLLSLELWQRQFIDRHAYFKSLLTSEEST